MLDSSSQACDHETHRIWSLWDIMEAFSAVKLYELCTRITGQRSSLDRLVSSGSGGQTGDGVTAEVRALFSDVEKFCGKSGFEVCRECAAVNGRHLEGNERDFSTLAAEVRNLSILLERDIFYRRFLIVSLDRSKYIDQEDLFGPAVYQAFPSARPDIKIGRASCRERV